MSAQFSAVHHYVPKWYQKQFIPIGKSQRKYHYLDLLPQKVQRPNGGVHQYNALHFLGPISCFQKENLYTLKFGDQVSDIIEKDFFGRIDDRGAKAVQFFHEWEFVDGSKERFNDLLNFIGAQKLRTPKGLDALGLLANSNDHELILHAMQRLLQMNSTIWIEGVWEIHNCDATRTKFIVSDHPITTYNKCIFPLSSEGAYPRDAPIENLGTHTLYALSPTRLLVITNLGLVRNPWVNHLKRRENPRSFAPTMFDFRHIQTGREMSEHDVLAVNYILKRRARRYIAAAERDWLFPEKYLKSTMWNKLGSQFFLMPDPRKLTFSTETLVGYENGSSWGMDEYGRKPRIKDSDAERLRRVEWRSFQKHKNLWEAKFGKLSAQDLKKYW